MEERLQKILSRWGLFSRREAEQVITAGRVQVNGVPAVLGQRADPVCDEICVDGRLLKGAPEWCYLLLHKPRGYVTTLSDEKGRANVAELVAGCGTRVYPVGRLDLNSEGLLLMTNDGDFANAMTHPSMHIPKTYRVTVRPSITEDQITEMTVGMMIDGKKTAPAQVNVISQEPGRVVLEIILYEGRNRQIRNMCEQLGLEVARLKRVACGPVKLGMLQPGEYRRLTAEEVKKLNTAAKSNKNAGIESRDGHDNRKTYRR